MEYIVTSPSKVYGKSFGEKFTESELIALGAKIERHLEAGTLTKSIPAPQAVKATPIKEEVQEPQVPVFNKYNNEGDK